MRAVLSNVLLMDSAVIALPAGVDYPYPVRHSWLSWAVRAESQRRTGRVSPSGLPITVPGPAILGT